MRRMATADSIHPNTRAAWRAWLQKHHLRGQGVWLIYYKLASGKKRFEYAEAVEEALCFGWIDGKAKTIDAERAMQWYTRRKPGSVWSPLNKERVARLTELGLMWPSGDEAVRRAKQDGSWTKMEQPDALVVPPDLAETLKLAGPDAVSNFAAFSPSVKRGMLNWIHMAKTASTRVQRIEATVTRAVRNERSNSQWRPTTSRQPTS